MPVGTFSSKDLLRQDLFLTELDLHVCKHMVTTLDAWSEPGRSVQTHMRPSPCKLQASTGIGCVRRNKSLTRPGLTALCVMNRSCLLLRGRGVAFSAPFTANKITRRAQSTVPCTPLRSREANSQTSSGLARRHAGTTLLTLWHRLC